MVRKIEDTVRQWLIRDQSLRDDDLRLIANIWWEKYRSTKLTQVTQSDMEAVSQFLYWFSRGDFPSPESVGRARRKLQEKYPELRGKLYEQRQKMAHDVKAEINAW